MTDSTVTSVIVPTLVSDWPKLVSVILTLAAGYLYARFHYAPVIKDLEWKISKLQWQLQDFRYERDALRNERDALQTRLELTQVQCDKMTDRAYSSAEENASLRGIIQQRYSDH